MKGKVLESGSNNVNTSETDDTYECNVIIRIHKDAIIEFGKNSHVVPLSNNDFNIRLNLIHDENDLNEDSTVDDTPHDTLEKLDA